MASAPHWAMTRVNRCAISSIASSQETGSNSAAPFGPTRRIGRASRRGE